MRCILLAFAFGLTLCGSARADGSAASQIAGATYSSDEAACRLGKCYSTSTALQNIASGSVLQFCLSNPAGSGRTLFTLYRFIAQTGANTIQYQQFTNATIASPTALVSAPRYPLAGVAAVGKGTWASSTTTLANGNAGPTLPLFPASEDQKTIFTIIGPGGSSCYVVSAAGNGGLTAATPIAVTQAWWEE